jgi:hypothetical protein
MNALTYICQLRFRQISRYLAELGALRLFLFLGVVALGFWQVYITIGRAWPASVGFMGLMSFSLLNFHLSRTDRVFLQECGLSFSRVCYAEYTIFTLPITIILIFTPLPWLAIIWQVIAFTVSKLPSKKKGGKSRISRIQWLPQTAFEWKAGMRVAYPSLILYYLLALGSMGIPLLPPIFILALALKITGFYTTCEPYIMLEATASSPTQLLIKKWKQGILGFTIGVLPIIIIYLVLYATVDRWAIVLCYVMLSSYVILTFAISFKYALYRPDTDLSVNSLLIGILTVTMLMPISSPLALVATVRYWFKAKNNLVDFLEN